MNYREYIQEIVDIAAPGDIFYLDRVAQQVAEAFAVDEKTANNVARQNLKRLTDKGIIERYYRGIYYKPEQNILGLVPVDEDRIIRDLYLFNGDEQIGYDTGAVVANLIGLTSWVPARQEIVTNVFTGHKSELAKQLRVTLYKPKTKIMRENARYLQILDTIDLLDKTPVDRDDPVGFFVRAIDLQELNFGKLFEYANAFYSEKVICFLGKIAERKL